MVSSRATTVAAYLAELPADRKRDISRLRSLIRKHLPSGFKETMQFGMIGYIVPLSAFSDTYNGQPLAIVALASQKNYMSVYLSGVYGDDKLRKWFDKAYADSGKKLDMGKSCVRFKAIDDLPLSVIGEAVSRVSVAEFIAMHERVHGPAKVKRARRRA